ncbi:MAG: hypothetical protein WCP92_03755 [bacterium]
MKYASMLVLSVQVALVNNPSKSVVVLNVCFQTNVSTDGLAAVAAIFAVAVVYHSVPVNLPHDASLTTPASLSLSSSLSVVNPAIVAAILSVLPLITVPTSASFTHASVNHFMILALSDVAVISVDAKVESIVVGGVFSFPYT